MTDRYIVVTGTETPDVVRAYLYGWDIVDHQTFNDGLSHAYIVRVQVSRDDYSQEVRDVEYLAKYQADRLRSGWMGAEVFPTIEDASRRLEEVTAGV